MTVRRTAGVANCQVITVTSQEGQWAATFVYPTGAAQALERAKKILIDCAASAPKSITVATELVSPQNAKGLYQKLKF